MDQTSAASALPPPPTALLEALRGLESRLGDTAAEIRALREALERRDAPAAEVAAGHLSLTGEGTLTMTGRAFPASGTARSVSGASGDVEVIPAPSGSGSGTLQWKGSASGEAPPELTRWTDKARKAAPTVARVVETAVRIWSTIN